MSKENIEGNVIAIPELTKDLVLSSANARAHAKRGTESFKVPYSQIKVREGWNVREDYGDIEALAKSILENGQISPLRGDMMEDGTFVPTDGHRRCKAFEWIVNSGSPADELMIEVVLNSTKISDEERLIQMWTSNDSKPLEPMEKAELCKRLTNIGYTPIDIAKKLGISRMHVDSFLVLAGISPEEKKAVVEKAISPTAMVKLAKSEKSATVRKEKINEAKETKSKVKVKDIPTPKTITGKDLIKRALDLAVSLEDKVELTEVNTVRDLIKIIRKIKPLLP